MKLQYLAFSCSLFILSLMSKPQAITLPIVLLAIDAFYGRLDLKNIFREKWMFLVAIAGFMHFSISQQVGLLEISNFSVSEILPKLGLTLHALSLYIVKNFIPFKLSCLYPYPKVIGVIILGIVFFLLIVIFVAFVKKIKENNQKSLLVFGCVFFLVTIMIPIILMWVAPWHNGFAVNDHYMYLPSIGLFLVLALIFEYYFQRSNYLFFWFANVLLITYVLILSVITYKYCDVWKDSISLWTHVIKEYPDSSTTAVAYFNRGAAYGRLNNDVKALADLDKALTLHPNYDKAYYNRGVILGKEGKYTEAIAQYSKVISINADFVEAYNNRAIAYFHINDYTRSWEDVHKAQDLGFSVNPAFINRLKSCNREEL